MRSSDKIIRPGNVTPGLAARNTQFEINRENKERQRNNSPETGDVANRKYVQTKIIEYVNSGLLKEEIIEKILQDPIMKEFEYLKASGVELKTCVVDWVENAIKRNSKENKGRFCR